MQTNQKMGSLNSIGDANGTASNSPYSNRGNGGGKTSDNAWCKVTRKQKHNHKHNNNNNNNTNSLKKSTFQRNINHSMMDASIPDDELLNEVIVLNFKETILAAARNGTLDDPNDWSDDDDEWSLVHNDSIEDETIDDIFYSCESTSNAFILDLDNNKRDDDNIASNDDSLAPIRGIEPRSKDEKNTRSVKKHALSQFMLGAFLLIPAD